MEGWRCQESSNGVWGGGGSICLIVFAPSASSVLSSTEMSIHFLKISVYS